MKNEKGITLIELVITVIILLILAGVTISMLSPDYNVVGNAKTAKETYNNEREIENGKLDQYAALFNDFKGNKTPQSTSPWVVSRGVTNATLGSMYTSEDGNLKFQFKDIYCSRNRRSTSFR